MRPGIPAISAALILGACASPPDIEARVDASHGAALFAARCASCHGADGRGHDGPARDWTPPDLTALSARNGGTFPEIDVLATIDGLARHADPSAVMPEFGAGDLGPTTIVEIEEGLGTPVPADLVALSAYLKTIQRP